MSDWKDVIVSGIGIIILIAIILFLVKCDSDKDASLWNNGYCPCGGEWQYEQAVGHRYSTSYIYRCDKCGDIIEIDHYENKEPIVEGKSEDFKENNSEN